MKINHYRSHVMFVFCEPLYDVNSTGSGLQSNRTFYERARSSSVSVKTASQTAETPNETRNVAVL